MTDAPQELLTNQELDDLAAQIPYVKAWLAAVETELLTALEDGVKFKNVRLVPKDARRKWADTDIIKLLKKFSPLDIVAPRVPLSPTQAEKTLGGLVYRTHLAEFVVRESSGMKLAYNAENAENEED